MELNIPGIGSLELSNLLVGFNNEVLDVLRVGFAEGD